MRFGCVVPFGTTHFLFYGGSNMSIHDELYNKFLHYSDEQLESVLYGKSYTKDAKETAKEILEKRKDGTLEKPNKEELAERKVDSQANYIQKIANDVSTIKIIMLIFAIISGISALITFFSFSRF